MSVVADRPIFRAREPDDSGFALGAGGLRIAYEVYGTGEPTVVLTPSAPIVHSRQWKGQIPYLARHLRVVAYDGIGNGRSDRPDPARGWPPGYLLSELPAVLDASGTETAVLVGLCGDGIWPSILFAARQPERVLGLVAIAPGVPLLTPPHPWRGFVSFEDERGTDEGWAKENLHYWRRDWPGYLEFFFGQMYPEPHSTKQIEDVVSWALEGTWEINALDQEIGVTTREEAEAECRRLRCPVLVVQGDRDNCQPFERGAAFAELTGADRVVLEGSGHIPPGRDPVKINLLVRDFAQGPVARGRTTTWTRARQRPKRALLVSSPIGLGHAWRDVAIARELRRQVPGLQVEWLAQHPVTEVLEECGESVHPASSELARESDHIDQEAGEHDLHAFHAIRRMDEILCANFMLFHDVVTEEHFDVWIGDEAWEVDYFLHENPELKTSAYVWLTDFVGFLPMPAGGEREAFLTADYNAEMIEQVERYPRIRDRSIFIGDPDDIVDAHFGPGLPRIREWVEGRYSFAGYIPAVDPTGLPERESLRGELGWAEDDVVCLVSVGGSGVGASLLRKVLEAVPAMRARIPNLRTVAVAGPRIDPASLGANGEVDVHGYVHELYRLSAACDVAIVQGGLSTTMELVAARRPFVSVPLASHFEQRYHVRHRLDRYGARTRLEYAELTPERLADTVTALLASELSYRPVTSAGATRAAALIAELV